MKTLAKLLSDQYPETLKRVIVHGAPWIFGSEFYRLLLFFTLY
jgi:hypothetical protein